MGRPPVHESEYGDDGELVLTIDRARLTDKARERAIEVVDEAIQKLKK